VVERRKTELRRFTDSSNLLGVLVTVAVRCRGVSATRSSSFSWARTAISASVGRPFGLVRERRSSTAELIFRHSVSALRKASKAAELPFRTSAVRIASGSLRATLTSISAGRRVDEPSPVGA
jgi:hypothetical protein